MRPCGSARVHARRSAAARRGAPEYRSHGENSSLFTSAWEKRACFSKEGPPQRTTPSLNKSIKFQDDLAQLIRIFIQMANRVEQREQNLQRQVKKLNIKLEIDQKKKLKDVKNLTENDEFKNIKSIVTMLKNNN